MSRYFRKSKHKDPRDRFAAWAAQCGAEVLARKDYEFARFVAGGVLCIIHENKHGTVTAWSPTAIQEAYEAWVAGRHFDLKNDPADAEVEDWHAVGKALCAVAARVKAGEDIELDAEAAAIRIPPARLLRALRAHGAVIPEITS